MVFRLIYRSHSRVAPDDERTALGDIFATARRNNREQEITGALVVADGAFAQTLEGDEAAVRALYARICEDERHDDVTLLAEESVDERTFGRWAMARVSEDGGPDIRLLSHAEKRTIVAASPDVHITREQESVLARMRESIARETA
jgi:hypothetical protein